MELQRIFYLLAVALGLGLLVGLQRERSETRLAGFRTFPIITVFGTVCAMLARDYGGWVIAAGFLALAAMVFSGNLARMKMGETDPGLTTEVSILLMFGVGAYLVNGLTPVAVAIGGGVAVLLYLKPQLHALAAKIGEADFKAIMQFVLITLVILPVLPNQTYGPYAVLNPHRLWLFVVFIVAISLAGYVAYKFFSRNAGAMISGVLGGLISSTATTVSYARRSHAIVNSENLAAFVILVASTILYCRVLVILAAIAPLSLSVVAPPLGAMLGALVVLCVGLWFKERHDPVQMPEQTNPTELKPAIVFGLLLAVVLLATAAGKAHFGEGGLYVVAALSGFTDVDAISLSTAQMIKDNRLDADTGWRLILLASLSNLIFKGLTVAVLGTRRLLARIAVLFAVVFAVGISLLVFWPRS
ncbi:MAG: MgtC/SapB family protein [Verrucomicrobia bacterium]|nr:MgtC/SapB family protein [Verrucomicrobiota bacterium]